MNETVFSGKANVYAHHRPLYSQQALDLIRREINITDDTLIADIGAGTGIFTKQLSSLGCRVAAVEPNEDMRSHIKNTAPEAEIVSAPAEKTGLPDHSVSLITVATALHWFDQALFAEECRRILTADGKVLIIWNLTDKTADIVKQLHELNLKYCEKYKALFANDTVLKDRFIDLTKEFMSEYEQSSYVNDQSFDLECFIGERLSCSYAIKPGEEGYETYVAALTDFFNAHKENEKITIPHFTHCFIGTV